MGTERPELDELDRQIGEAKKRLHDLRSVMEKLIWRGREYERTWRSVCVTIAGLVRLRQSRFVSARRVGTKTDFGLSPTVALPNQLLAVSHPLQVPAGAALLNVGATSDSCYFIQRGLVSLCRPYSEMHWIEVGTAGPGSLVGLWPIWGAAASPYSAIAQTDCAVLKMSAAVLRALQETDPIIRHMVTEQVFMRATEFVILAACNAEHPLGQRLARHLLIASAALRSDALQLTHERLAFLLGTRRASVTLALQRLKARHAIRTRRSRIEIRDVKALEACSCGCERMLRRSSPNGIRSAGWFPSAPVAMRTGFDPS